MKKQILTAAAILVGTIVSADNHGNHDNMMRSRDLTGSDLYTAAVTEGYKWDAEVEFSNIDPEWNRIGEIEDLVLDANGQLIGVIAEVGGILDMGDKHVMMTMEEVAMFKADSDGDDDYVFVTGLTLDQLKDRENMDEGFWE